MSITQNQFGKLESGESVSLFTLKNENGLAATITNYGGIIVSLTAPDRNGDFADVVLGKDSLADYLAGHPYFGCITGRVAGRIAKAHFDLDGHSYDLAVNNGPNCLHGGLKGYDKVLWNAEIVELNGVEKLRLSTIDPDGNNNFPGTVNCAVTYALLDDNALEITYTATTDKRTPLNLTNHSYFNLKGSGNVLGHEVQIFSDAVATIAPDATLLGRKDPVVPGFNDYRQPVALKDRASLTIDNADIHYFLDGGRTAEPRLAAVVREPESGRIMEVLTTEPGVQFYAGLFLSADGPEAGKNGVIYERSGGLCLETQDYADSVNFPEMGGAVLNAGETFESTTLYRFKAE